MTLQDKTRSIPHVVYRDVLGEPQVRTLLEYVRLNASYFEPALVQARTAGPARLDPGRRDCLFFTGARIAAAPLAVFIETMIADVLDRLRLADRDLALREFEIASYGDGGHFDRHIDTGGSADHVRLLSCVYYFSMQPPRFGGGQLRLHPLPTRDMPSDGWIDLDPLCDSLVIFPSWLRHEVLPVRLTGGAWMDRRFSINCWAHRRHSAHPRAPADARQAHRGLP